MNSIKYPFMLTLFFCVAAFVLHSTGLANMLEILPKSTNLIESGVMAVTADPAQSAFRQGMLHGLLLFVSTAAVILHQDVTLYASHLSSINYDLGFALGVMIFIVFATLPASLSNLHKGFK